MQILTCTKGPAEPAPRVSDLQRSDVFSGDGHVLEAHHGGVLEEVEREALLRAPAGALGGELEFIEPRPEERLDVWREFADFPVEGFLPTEGEIGLRRVESPHAFQRGGSFFRRHVTLLAMGLR